MRDSEKFNKDANSNVKQLSPADSILSRIKQYSFARQNRFALNFTLTDSVSGYIQSRDSSINQERMNKIIINCTRITTPDKSLNVSDTANSAHESTIVLGGYLKPTISVSFVCSADMKEKVMLDYWLDYIYDFDGRSVKFLDDYSCDMIISQLDAKNNATYSLKIEKAFPMAVQSLQYDYQPSNMPVMVDAIFNYSYLRTYNY